MLLRLYINNSTYIVHTIYYYNRVAEYYIYIYIYVSIVTVMGNVSQSNLYHHTHVSLKGLPRLLQNDNLGFTP